MTVGKTAVRVEGIGIAVGPASGGAGVRITEVAPDGGGAKAHLRVGDTISEVAGVPVRSPFEFQEFWLAEAARCYTGRIPIKVTNAAGKGATIDIRSPIGPQPFAKANTKDAAGTGSTRTCPNGHPATGRGRFCSTCGIAVPEPLQTNDACLHGHPMADGDVYCQECGSAGNWCSNGHAVSQIQVFCPQCGATLADQAGAPSRTTRPPMTAHPAFRSGDYAEWGPRAAGYLLDLAVSVGPLIFAYVLFAAMLGSSAGLAVLILLAGWLWSGIAGIWFAIQVGSTGQSPGMRVVGIRCVGEVTGLPIGPAMGFVRGLAHVADMVIFYIGFLLPLWDVKRQTLADKIIGTVVVPAPKQAFRLRP